MIPYLSWKTIYDFFQKKIYGYQYLQSELCILVYGYENIWEFSS